MSIHARPSGTRSVRLRDLPRPAGVVRERQVVRVRSRSCEVAADCEAVLVVPDARARMPDVAPLGIGVALTFQLRRPSCVRKTRDSARRPSRTTRRRCRGVTTCPTSCRGSCDPCDPCDGPSGPCCSSTVTTLSARRERELAVDRRRHVGVHDLPAPAAVARRDDPELPVHRIRERQAALPVEEGHAVVEGVRVGVLEVERPMTPASFVQ